MTSPFRALRHRRALAGPLGLVGVAIILFSVLFMTGASAHGADAAVSSDPQDIANGAVLYQAHCQSCHGYQGEGGVVKGAPGLVDVGAAAADFYLTTGRMPLNAPNNEALRHHPAFSDTQIRALVAYIAALPDVTGKYTYGPGIPTVQPLCADQTNATTKASDCVTLSEGEALYAVNCEQCHQSSGAGGMLSKGDIIPGLHNANLTQIAEAPRVGPKPMPVWGPNQLSDHQISAIAQYVHYLNNRTSPGGLGISGFGPVAEGFVGVLVGFVVLWFAARMIGTRG